MKRMSNNTENIPRPNLVKSPKKDDQSSKLYESMIIWSILKLPPVKSSNTFPILHPTVLFLLKFIHAWGIYLTIVMPSLTYEAHVRNWSQSIASHPAEIAVLMMKSAIPINAPIHGLETVWPPLWKIWNIMLFLEHRIKRSLLTISILIYGWIFTS